MGEEQFRAVLQPAVTENSEFGDTKMRKKVIEDIRGKIRLLNHIVTFIVFVLLFLIVRFLYYSWDFVTNPSIVAMLSIIAFLSIISLYLSNKVSKQASNEIEDYSSKLDNMLNH